MSAPDTNVEKQTRRHKPSLLGIGAAVAIAIAVAALVVTWGGNPAEDQAVRGPIASEDAQ